MWDLSLPGYKYLGPGNKLNKGKPTSFGDAVAYEHDKKYSELLKQGKNPYLKWNQADIDFLRDIKLNEYGTWLGAGFFNAKRSAYKAGLIGHVNDAPSKRLRGPLDKDVVTTSTKRLRGTADTDVGRKPKPTETNTISLLNSRAMADGEGSGNEPGLKETPIDNPYVIYRGPPDYTFASLPYVETRYTQDASWYARDHIFRLTSPYDVSQANATTDANVGAGTMKIAPESADATQSQARWWDYYSGLYNYYHVVSCQYHVLVENLSMEPLWVYKMFYNDDQPSPLATNEDMQLWKGCSYQFCDRRGLAIDAVGQIEHVGEHAANEIARESATTTAAIRNFENTNMVSNNGKPLCVFSGEYKAGDFRREIRLDSSVENWTATNTNPLLPEKLLIRVKPVNDALNLNSADSYGDTLSYRFVIHLNYLVEFKELPVTLRYPLQRQPLTVTIAADPVSTN